jgi:large subunit ribosomal protein L10
VEELRTLLSDAKTFFLVDYQGLSADQIGKLRTRCATPGAYVGSEKHPGQRRLERAGNADLGSKLTGPTALILIGDDPVAPQKLSRTLPRTTPNDLPVPKGGLLQGAVIEADAIARVAKLPAREQLLSELLGVLQAPLQQAVGVLEAAPRNLVSVITNYSEKS